MVNKQFALVYVGHFSIADLDAMGVREFEVFFKLLERQAKDENAQRAKVRTEAEARRRAAESRNRFQMRKGR